LASEKQAVTMSNSPVPVLTTLVSVYGARGALYDTVLIADASGNLFGTTLGWGTDYGGTVFEIAKTAGGYANTPTTLVTFNRGNAAGPNPGLLADASGNLFGTTAAGGANDDGTVFEIAKTAGGYANTLTTLVSFNLSNGVGPHAGLIADASGNLFGTTFFGGANNYGTVFEIAKTAGGYANTPTILVTFNGITGGHPETGLLADASGNLFGTTLLPSTYWGGTVFEIVKTANGYANTPTTLVTFNGTNGTDPDGALIADASGNLIGTMAGGGANGGGTVFEIAKTVGGYANTPTTLVAFNGINGSSPQARLIADASGNLFGTTSTGGANQVGTVFEISKTANGYANTPTTLVSFNGSNGNYPSAGLLADATGNLLGTISSSNTYSDYSTVFEITGSGFVVLSTSPKFQITYGTQTYAVTLTNIAADFRISATLGGPDIQVSTDVAAHLFSAVQAIVLLRRLYANGGFGSLMASWRDVEDSVSHIVSLKNVLTGIGTAGGLIIGAELTGASLAGPVFLAEGANALFMDLLGATPTAINFATTYSLMLSASGMLGATTDQFNQLFAPSKAGPLSYEQITAEMNTTLYAMLLGNAATQATKNISGVNGNTWTDVIGFFKDLLGPIANALAGGVGAIGQVSGLAVNALTVSSSVSTLVDGVANLQDETTFAHKLQQQLSAIAVAAAYAPLTPAGVQLSAAKLAAASSAVIDATRSTSITGPPTVVSIATSPATGAIGAGDVVTFTLGLSAAVTVAGGVPALLLSNGGAANYTGGSGTNTLRFGYTVAAGQSTADLVVTGLALNGAMISAQSTLEFHDQATYSAGSYPGLAATADMNGDGNLDIIVPNFGFSPSSGGVSILWGDGNGAFSTSTTYAVGYVNSSVTTADLNGDGKLDLIVASNNDGTQNSHHSGNISVLLADGSGGFGAPISYAAGTNPFVVVADDVNHDGKPDLIVAMNWGNFGGPVSVLLGDGNGGFGAAKSYDLGGAGAIPEFITASDVNADGNVDLVVACEFGVVVLLGDGSGGFGAANVVARGSNFNSVATGDVNGDGKTDIVFTDFDGYNGSVSVLLGDGGGGFGGPMRYAAGTAISTWSVTIADMNGDGKADIIAGSYPNGVTVLLGDGHGGFGAATPYGGELSGAFVTTADMNRDGKPDIILADRAHGVSVLLNTSASPSTLDSGTVTTAPGHDTGLVANAPPTPLILAEISSATYADPLSVAPIAGYKLMPTQYNDVGFRAEEFRNGNQIVVAFRGTDLSNLYNAVFNAVVDGASWAAQDARDFLSSYVTLASLYLATIIHDSANLGTQITLTGHSLGGAIAQILGDASWLRTEVFNAPGTGQWLNDPAIKTAETAVKVAGNGIRQANVDYRMHGDLFSDAGTPAGSTITIASPYAATLGEWYNNHKLGTVVSQLKAHATETLGIEYDAVINTVTAPIHVAADTVKTVYHYALDVGAAIGNAASNVWHTLVPTVDPISYLVTEAAGSPGFASLILSAVPGVSEYAVSTEAGGIWSPEQVVTPGGTFTPGGTLDAFRFHALDATGHLAIVTDPVVVNVAFGSVGSFVGDIAAQQAVSANVFNWTGGTGGFGIAANWIATSGGAAAPPWSVDEADFVANAGTISGLGSAYRMLFDGSTPWTVIGTLAAASEIAVGQTPGTVATLRVAAGGVVTSADTIKVGAATGSSGAVGLTTGTLSTLGGITLGGSGTGTATIGAGGTLSAQANGIILGQQATGSGLLVISSSGLVSAQNTSGGPALDIGLAGSGDVFVTGTGSVLGVAGTVDVGDAGLGNLSIRSGGTVLTVPVTGTASTAVYVGRQAGSDGSSVSVTGAGSNWQITGGLYIGTAAAGSLSVTAGGSLNAATLDLGVAVGGSGVVSVVGASHLVIGGHLTIGDGGSAGLSIFNGGIVTAADADLGLLGAGTGNVDLEGAGSRLNVSHNLNVGGLGLGVMTVGQGSTLTVANDLNQGAKGVLNVVGGIVDPASGTLSGSTTISSGGVLQYTNTLTLKGQIVVQNGNGTLEFAHITGNGTLVVGTNGTMILTGGTGGADGPLFVGSPSPSITFSDNTGTLVIQDLAGFSTTTTITAFTSGDMISIPSLTFASTQVVNTNTLDLLDAGSNVVGTLTFNASTVSGTTLAAGVTGAAPCYREGTLIETDHGPIAVETLRIGDHVLSHFGGLVPVQWLGWRRVDCRNHPQKEDVWPVRVDADAFGPGLPRRALWLSPDHAVYVDDVLIPIRYLINGATISQVAMDAVVYYHVELPSHDVLLAEGMPAESFLDTGNRNAFANGGPAVQLHPDFALKVWEAESCAKLVFSGPKLTDVQADLLVRAEVLGHMLSADAAPMLRIDGRRFDAAGQIDLPLGTRKVLLESRSFVPAWTTPEIRDHRRLGVAVTSLYLDGVPMALDDERLGAGWHAGEDGLRWTDGAAVINVSGARTLSITLANIAGAYWQTEDAITEAVKM
jgi:T5SS/PEP-CTERM-associated repeat protein/uncharacterized repeat protein (TIGR03803 family)